MTESEYPNDLHDFIITCKKCKFDNVQIDFKYRNGSEETGVYDERLTFRCRQCGHTEEGLL